MSKTGWTKSSVRAGLARDASTSSVRLEGASRSQIAQPTTSPLVMRRASDLVEPDGAERDALHLVHVKLVWLRLHEAAEEWHAESERSMVLMLDPTTTTFRSLKHKFSYPTPPHRVRMWCSAHGTSCELTSMALDRFVECFDLITDERFTLAASHLRGNETIAFETLAGDSTISRITEYLASGGSEEVCAAGGVISGAMRSDPTNPSKTSKASAGRRAVEAQASGPSGRQGEIRNSSRQSSTQSTSSCAHGGTWSGGVVGGIGGGVHRGGAGGGAPGAAGGAAGGAARGAAGGAAGQAAEVLAAELIAEEKKIKAEEAERVERKKAKKRGKKEKLKEKNKQNKEAHREGQREGQQGGQQGGQHGGQQGRQQGGQQEGQLEEGQKDLADEIDHLEHLADVEPENFPGDESVGKGGQSAGKGGESIGKGCVPSNATAHLSERSGVGALDDSDDSDDLERRLAAVTDGLGLVSGEGSPQGSHLESDRGNGSDPTADSGPSACQKLRVQVLRSEQVITALVRQCVRERAAKEAALEQMRDSVVQCAELKRLLRSYERDLGLGESPQARAWPGIF